MSRHHPALAPRERLWTGIGISTTYGPLRVPGVPELRRAAGALAAALPALRLDERLDLAASCWRPQGRGPAAAGADAVLVWDGPGPDQVGVVEHERAVQHLRPVDVPLRFVVAGDHVTVLMSHAAGDATLAVGALSALLLEASGAGLPAWTAARPTRAPLRRALAETYLRTPRQLVAALRAARPLPDPLPRVDLGPERAVVPDPDTVHALVPPRVLTGTKAWRLAHARGAVTTALHAVMVAEALAEVGLPPLGGPTVLFDARRYLPDGAVVHGNFVSGLALRVQGPWTVAGLSAQVQEAVEASRPLSAMAVGAAAAAATGLVGDAAALLPGARARRRSALDGPRWRAPERPRPVLAVSSVRNPAMDRLPWAAPAAQCVVVPLLTAAPATGMTALMTEVRGCLNVSLSFHGTVFDRDVVQAAADLVAADPVRLLDRSLARAAAAAPDLLAVPGHLAVPVPVQRTELRLAPLPVGDGAL